MTANARNAEILALKGQKSFTLIAEELDLTRNVVAGVFFRDRWPAEIRYGSPTARNKIGTGHQGPGTYAEQTLQRGASARPRLVPPALPFSSYPTEAIDLIQALCAAGFRVSPDALRGASRKAEVVHARHVAMALAREFTIYSLHEIGRRFGRRDHSTVFHAIHKIVALVETDPAMAAELDLLRAAIAGAQA